MKFSIIINTHNQKKYLNKAIMSCLSQDFKDYEIIICDTSDKKRYSKFNKAQTKKKIYYFHFLPKYSQPELNQMHKVFFGIKKAKGDFICLMDGDDYFHNKKLYFLNRLINNKKILCNQDNPSLIKDGHLIKKNIREKKYKNNILFNTFFNNWPQIYGTSSIVVKKKILETFFKRAKPFNWKYLAIDAQLIIFCKINFKITKNLKNITKKRIHNKNLGNAYVSLFKKKFWIRRYMQHQYYTFLTKKKMINFDTIITACLSYFMKKLYIEK